MGLGSGLPSYVLVISPMSERLTSLDQNQHPLTVIGLCTKGNTSISYWKRYNFRARSYYATHLCDGTFALNCPTSLTYSEPPLHPTFS
jgi:hypothetical protein